MAPTIAILALAVSLSQGPADGRPRKPHPLAPSIPLLTKGQYDEFDRIIERFILYDTGMLSGAEGAKALAEFKQLGPAAIFSLIAGLNRAANMPASCPAVIIGKKIAQILSASNDVALLDYARENIGTEVTVRRHMGTIRDLKLHAMLRRNAVAASGAALATTPLAELGVSLLRERGDKLRHVLLELERRPGADAMPVLARAIPKLQAPVQQMAYGVLLRRLARAASEQIREALRNEEPTLRAAAAFAAGQRRLPLGAELIDLLDDRNTQVQQTARQALVVLSGGQDFGPNQTAGESERSTAVRDWRMWLDGQR